MTPKVPQTNLFHIELRNLSDRVAGYGRFFVAHKWYVIGTAAVIAILFFWMFRGSRQ